MQVLGPHEASDDKIKTLVGVGAENLVLEKSQGAAPAQSYNPQIRASGKAGAPTQIQIPQVHVLGIKLLPRGGASRVWGRNRVLKRNGNKTPLLSKHTTITSKTMKTKTAL